MSRASIGTWKRKSNASRVYHTYDTFLVNRSRKRPKIGLNMGLL